jgi:Ankyrin repeats (3 copies)
MLALASSFDDDALSIGAFLLRQHLDTASVLALWIGIFVWYSLFVKCVAFGSFDTLRFYDLSFWKDTLLIQKIERLRDACCPRRRARFFKCAKRCDRRQAKALENDEASHSAAWSCPFECPFVRIPMPAPLPFRKKKRSKAAEPATTGCEKEEVAASQKSNRRNRLKHLDVDYCTESESDSSRSTGSVKEASALIPSLPVTPASLIDLALMQNWPQLLINLKARRREARERDIDGLYALHWAVSGGPPLEVVKALVKAYPGACKKVDSEGSNALHFASHYGGSVAMVELLLATYPKAVRVKDKYGRSPLYHAVDKAASIDVLRLLAGADPSMVTTPCKPNNHEKLEQGKKSWDHLTPLYLAWVKVLADKRSAERCCGKIWDKARLLLDTAYRHKHGMAQSSDRAEAPLIPAILVLNGLLPEELAEVVIRQAGKEDLLRIDPVLGKNPLALVASMAELSQSRSGSLIRLLVEVCPSAAAHRDREGRTALANAAASGKGWDAGVESLLHAAPDALGWSDNDGMPPSLLAAASSPSNCKGLEHPVLLADPYNLFGVKGLALRRRALEQARLLKEAKGLKPLLTGDTGNSTDRNAAHLSTIYRLIIEDPAWIG